MKSNAPARSITVILGPQSGGCHSEPLLRAIDNDPQLKLDLVLCGERTSPELDTRCCQMVSQGYRIRKRIELPRAAETPSGIVTLPTHQRVAFAEALHAGPTDLVLLLGKAEDMLAAAQAARAVRVPIAYVHNGEASNQASASEAYREITNIAHLHFVTSEQAQQELTTQGEAAWRITNGGDLLLDELRDCGPLREATLARRLGRKTEERPLVVTFIPDSHCEKEASQQINDLLEAIRFVDMPTVFAYPAEVTVAPGTLEAIREFASDNPQAHLAARCDWQTYWSLLRKATALVSNGPTGIVEASWLNLPLVSIRDGEQDPDCPQVGGVITSDYSRSQIFAATATVTAKEFPSLYEKEPSPYGDGTSAEKIAARLKSVAIDSQLLEKTEQPVTAIALPHAAEPAMAHAGDPS